MTEYQFIRMVTGEKPRTWYVLNRKYGSMLGLVSYYPAWRQFTFDAAPDCTFSAGCLRDIAGFLDEQRRSLRTPTQQPALIPL